MRTAAGDCKGSDHVDSRSVGGGSQRRLRSLTTCELIKSYQSALPGQGGATEEKLQGMEQLQI